MSLIKQTIGVEDFSDVYAKTNKKRVDVKEERKRKLAQTVILDILFCFSNSSHSIRNENCLTLKTKAITDPQMMAMKKINRMQKKKEAKKRKISKYQTEKMDNGKRRKNNHRENQNDYD